MQNLFNRTLLTVVFGAFSITVLAQKSETPKGWHLLDLNDNGYYGISADKAYQFIKSKKLQSTPVIVAILDSGIDTTHEDLKPVLWRNPGEIPGNGIDDDKNGYVDDVYGWNFLGGRDGKNVEKDSYESVRVYHKYKSKWQDKNIDVSTLSADEKYEYEMWKKSEKEVVGDGEKIGGLELLFMKRSYASAEKSDSQLQIAMGKAKYTGKELDKWNPGNSDLKRAKTIMMNLFELNEAMETLNSELLEEFKAYVDGEESKLSATEKGPEDFRGNIVKDNYEDINDRFYGNGDVMVSLSASVHGTHVAGIVGAARKNGKGMDGVADNVKIMMVRVVPSGADEHDKDIALGIRYAVDNGARVINMSFGKEYSPEKKWIDEAVKYAQSKGVLLVAAAGNEKSNIDERTFYPTPVMLDSTKATNWITVGASGDPTTGGLAAYFSNYGKKGVDVFAPGVKIYSTVPGGNTYRDLQGTSMASPVVAGLAALILEYYPNLTPEQVKYAIVKSAQVPAQKVLNPGTNEMVDFSELSNSGGIINAYEALKIASELQPETKKPSQSQVKEKQKA
jgi:subtilisin family serine protease